MNRAVVLAAGGAAGAYPAGMLDELVGHQGLDFQIIRGVSVGALSGALLAQAHTGPGSLLNLQKAVHDLKHIWLDEIKGNRSVYRKRGGLLGCLLGKNSLYDNTPLCKLMEKHLDVDVLRRSGRDFKVGTVSLLDGHYRECGPEQPGFLDFVLASTAIPGVFPPVDVDGDVQVDGGVRNITPLASAFHAQPDEIYVLLTSRVTRNEDGTLPRSTVPWMSYESWRDNLLGTKFGAKEVLARSIEILCDEIFLDDIRHAIKWNHLTEDAAFQGFEFHGSNSGKRHVPLYVLAPREWYGPKNDSLDFDPVLIRGAIEHGKKVAADRSLWLWPPRPG